MEPPVWTEEDAAELAATEKKYLKKNGQPRVRTEQADLDYIDDLRARRDAHADWLANNPPAGPPIDEPQAPAEMPIDDAPVSADAPTSADEALGNMGKEIAEETGDPGSATPVWREGDPVPEGFRIARQDFGDFHTAELVPV